MSRLSSLSASVLKSAAVALAAIVVVVITGGALTFYFLVEPRWSKFRKNSRTERWVGRTRATFSAADNEYFIRMDKELP
jgi:hypothetical protein